MLELSRLTGLNSQHTGQTLWQMERNCPHVHSRRRLIKNESRQFLLLSLSELVNIHKKKYFIVVMFLIFVMLSRRVGWMGFLCGGRPAKHKTQQRVKQWKSHLNCPLCPLVNYSHYFHVVASAALAAYTHRGRKTISTSSRATNKNYFAVFFLVFGDNFAFALLSLEFLLESKPLIYCFQTASGGEHKFVCADCLHWARTTSGDYAQRARWRHNEQQQKKKFAKIVFHRVESRLGVIKS